MVVAFRAGDSPLGKFKSRVKTPNLFLEPLRNRMVMIVSWRRKDTVKTGSRYSQPQA
jgi:hypothetical protein